MQRQFQDIASFKRPDERRGRSAWFVQFWWIFEALLVRPTPQVLYAWRRFAWRLFGARVGRNVLIRPGVHVTFPWNVEIGDYCWIGDNVTLYSIAQITIAEHSVVSQEAYLCTASHDHLDPSFPLITSPITLESECWIAARVFVGPGVRIGRGAVVGACSLIVSDAPPATIMAGIPARKIGERAVRHRAPTPQGVQKGVGEDDSGFRV